MRQCIVCGKDYDDFTPGARQSTCSEDCHQKYIDRLIQEFGEYKGIVDMTTGIKYKVPTRDILENGIRQEDLKNYPVWISEN